MPLAKLVGERSYSIACDHLGKPTAAYDEAEKRVWQRELDIYGRGRQEEGRRTSFPFSIKGNTMTTRPSSPTIVPATILINKMWIYCA